MRLVLQRQTDDKQSKEHEGQNGQQSVVPIFGLSYSALSARDRKYDLVTDYASRLQIESQLCRTHAGMTTFTHFPATEPTPNAKYVTPTMTERKLYGGFSKIWGITTVIPTWKHGSQVRRLTKPSDLDSPTRRRGFRNRKMAEKSPRIEPVRAMVGLRQGDGAETAYHCDGTPSKCTKLCRTMPRHPKGATLSRYGYQDSVPVRRRQETDRLTSDWLAVQGPLSILHLQLLNRLLHRDRVFDPQGLRYKEREHEQLENREPKYDPVNDLPPSALVFYDQTPYHGRDRWSEDTCHPVQSHLVASSLRRIDVGDRRRWDRL